MNLTNINKNRLAKILRKLPYTQSVEGFVNDAVKEKMDQLIKDKVVKL
tara:strand:+ start:261 stop:404 length:144 start_codon:yes stop_codon:yes gene_type:complete